MYIVNERKIQKIIKKLYKNNKPPVFRRLVVFGFL